MRKKFSIAIPASVVSDTPHLREKTAKIGLIGRAAAIFQVEEIIIYPDNPAQKQNTETEQIALLLSYMETPQYLRKRLFKFDPRLQYAGILPPLRTFHHPLNRQIKKLKIGEPREGVTVSQTEEGTQVDVGVEKTALIPHKKLPANMRVTVRIAKASADRLEAEIADRDEIQEYWGYKVTVSENSFAGTLKNRKFDLTIATSRLGTPISSVASKIAERYGAAESVLVAFGAPSQGLHGIAKSEGLNLEEVVDFVVNTIPGQGTETVRTEEAVFASLAVLNVLVFKV
ncbi:MAG: RNA methyltransferase [Candidatus Bathyarchaeia archaeon]